MLNFSRKSSSRKTFACLAELLDRTVALAAHDYDLKKKYDFRSIEIFREFPHDLPPVFCTPMAVLEHAVKKALERARLRVENRRYREHLEEVDPVPDRRSGGAHPGTSGERNQTVRHYRNFRRSDLYHHPGPLD